MMNDDSSDNNNNITAKFRSSAAYLLAAHVSPSLAALHAHRAAIQSHSPPLTLTPLHCPRCTHAPLSTRVVLANSSKQRTQTTTRRTRDLRDRETKNAKRGAGSYGNNKTHSVQTRKPESSSSQGTQSSSSSPRGNRVRVIQRSCAACGYVGDQALVRSGISSFHENNERPSQASRSAGLDEVLSSPSEPVSHPATPALVKDTDTSSIPIKSSASAKLKAKQAQAVTLAASPMTQPEPSHVGPPSVQSRSAIKRQKKKTGLQELLARSKEQKQSTTIGEDYKRDGDHHGLAAFLSGL